MNKIIIAGSRDFDNYELLDHCICDKLDAYKLSFSDIEIVSGNAKGADTLGIDFAKNNNIDLTIMPANWGRYGKSAGMRRNYRMAGYADNLIAFWNGKSKGTKQMIDIMRKLNKGVFIIKY